MGLFPPSAPPRQDPQRCHSPVSTGNGALPSVSPSATGSTAVPQSRHRREAALGCRSPHRLAQVLGHPGAGPKKWWGPAPRNCFQCFPVAQDSKRKTDLRRLAGGPAPPGEGTCAGRRIGATRRRTCATGRRDRRHQKEDLSHQQKGPAPPGEGTCATGRGDLRHQKEDLRHQKEDLRHQQKGPAPPGEGTCAGRTDLRHRERGLAPKERRTGATSRKDLRHQKEDLRHRERGPAPPGEGTGATRRRTGTNSRRDLLLRGRT